jgi:hypothetical protein
MMINIKKKDKKFTIFVIILNFHIHLCSKNKFKSFFSVYYLTTVNNFLFNFIVKE